MSEKLQQAIAFVKAGDKPMALQLLGEVLTTDPNNEQAWLWMSAVVSEDRRLYCIKRVLQINPDNQKALKAYATLAPGAKIPARIPISEPAEAGLKTSRQAASAGASAAEFETLPYFLVPDRDALHVIVFQEGNFRSAVTRSDQKEQVENSLLRGELPLSLLSAHEIIDFDRVAEVSQAERVLRIQYKVETSSQTLRLDCQNKQQAEKIFLAMQKQFGEKFERQQKAMSANFQVGLVFITFLFVAVVTFFLYYQSLAVVSGDLLVGKDSAISGLVSTLYSLGPFGVLLIGGAIMVGLWIWMVVLYRRPPQLSKLVKK